MLKHKIIQEETVNVCDFSGKEISKEEVGFSDGTFYLSKEITDSIPKDFFLSDKFIRTIVSHCERYSYIGISDFAYGIWVFLGYHCRYHCRCWDYKGGNFNNKYKTLDDVFQDISGNSSLNIGEVFCVFKDGVYMGKYEIKGTRFVEGVVDEKTTTTDNDLSIVF